MAMTKQEAYIKAVKNLNGIEDIDTEVICSEDGVKVICDEDSVTLSCDEFKEFSESSLEIN